MCALSHPFIFNTSYFVFRFPHKNAKLLKLWILAIRRSDWYPTKLSFICSKHFKNEDFVSLKGPNSRPKLKKDAIPSVFDFPKHYKRLEISYTASDTSTETETLSSRENIPIKIKHYNPPDFHQIKKFVLHDHSYG